jgi:Domain of unknown function (DUF1707)
MPGPGDQTPAAEGLAAEGRDHGDLRASHADRERVIGTVKAAFVQGRLTEDELDARVGQVYASRTYTELAAVTADIPTELTAARSPRDLWRATKIAWRIEYAIFLPGIVAALLLPGGPHTSVATVVILIAVVYLIFWILGVSLMIGSRPAKRPGRQLPRPSARALASNGMTRPGSEIVANGKPLPVTYADRERVIRTLKAALEQGRLTEDEHDERTARASVSRSHAELASLTADLPDGLTALPPRSRDVRIGVGVIIAAASVLAAVVLTKPDNYLAFMAALGAIATLIVAPVITVGLMIDVRHQKRSGGQLPLG